MKRFILVYRLVIVAEPDRVMMQVAENIWELVHKGAQTPASLMTRKRHLQQFQGVYRVSGKILGKDKGNLSKIL